MTSPMTISEKDRSRIARLCLMHDNFMTLVFDNNIPAAQLVVRVILGRDDLVVTKVTAQRNYHGSDADTRSARLDIIAQDRQGRVYDVEVQQEDRGALPQRARFYSSVIDSRMLKQGDSFETMRDSYIIFITEKDVLGKGLPLYSIDRVVTQTGEPFGDGSHIIYVNGSNRDLKTPLGRLMHDFHCTEAKDILNAELQSSVRHYKEEEVTSMCEIWKEVRDEGRMESVRDTVAVCRNFGIGDSDILVQIQKQYGLSLEEAEKYMKAAPRPSHV